MASAAYVRPRAGGPFGEDMAGDKAATQERILAAALGLFAKRGYNGTSVSAIAEAAGVSRSAVFWHFGDKASLFSEVFKRMLVPFLDRITNTYEHLTPGQQILEMFSVYESFVTDNRAAIETFVRWVMESAELRDLLSDQLFALQDAFTRKIERALTEASGDAEGAAELAAGLVAMLDGNFLLTLLDVEGKTQARRRAGLLRIAKLAVRPGRSS